MASNDTERRCCRYCGEPMKSQSWLWSHLIEEHPTIAAQWLLDDWRTNFKRAVKNSGRYSGWQEVHEFTKVLGSDGGNPRQDAAATD